MFNAHARDGACAVEKLHDKHYEDSQDGNGHHDLYQRKRSWYGTNREKPGWPTSHRLIATNISTEPATLLGSDWAAGQLILTSASEVVSVGGWRYVIVAL